MRTLLTALMLLATPVMAGDWEGDARKAWAARKVGDQQKAFRLIKPHAEQENAEAQSNLGAMYGNGWGVPKNGAKAVYWYRKAAMQGRVLAQNSLIT